MSLIQKKRILYACPHPTLKDVDLRVLIQSGFEVIPVLLHIQFHGQFRIDPRPSDNPLSNINQLWKKNCSIPKVDLEKIQKIDFFQVTDEPFTITANKEISVVNSHNKDNGEITDLEKQLINKYFDVIIIASFPNILAKTLGWFEGIIAFRLYGNERPGFNVWDWYMGNLYSEEFKNFFKYRDRYCSLLTMNSLRDTELAPILGSKSFTLNACVMEELEESLTCSKWLGIESLPLAVTNISYIDESPSWRTYFEEFDKNFKNTEYHVYGKNHAHKLPKKYRDKIKNQISDYNEYLERLAEYRVYCYIGKVRQHLQYTPFECTVLGIPVLFLKSSAISDIILQNIDKEITVDIGMCESLSEMAAKAKIFIENVEAAVTLAKNQRSYIYKAFGREIALKQVNEFKNFVENFKKASLNTNGQSNRDDLFLPSQNKKKRILYCYYYSSIRNEEVNLLIDSGFEVIPILMPSFCQTLIPNQDSEEDFLLIDWRSKLSIPIFVVENIRKIKIFEPDFRKSGNLSRENAEILNSHIGIIYLPGSINICMNLTMSGYKGRFINHYLFPMLNSKKVLGFENNIKTYLYKKIFDNYIVTTNFDGARKLNKTEIPSSLFEIPFIRKTAPKNSIDEIEGNSILPRIGVLIPNITNEAKEHYDKFILYFGHFPYEIFGKNSAKDLSTSNINDPNINGIADFSVLHKNIVKMRALVDLDIGDFPTYVAIRDAFSLGVPVIFLKKSFLGNELKFRLGYELNVELGACSSHEEMAVLVEQCLLEKNFVAQLMQKQLVLTKSFIYQNNISKIMEFHNLPEADLSWFQLKIKILLILKVLYCVKMRFLNLVASLLKKLKHNRIINNRITRKIKKKITPYFLRKGNFLENKIKKTTAINVNNDTNPDTNKCVG